MISAMLDYYNLVRKKNIRIMYSGPVWAGGIESIAKTLKKRLEYDELPLSVFQSVFSVFIEQMNNILMYSAEKEGFITEDNQQVYVSKGVFILGVHDSKYYLQSGNIASSNSVEYIKNKIDYLNTLNRDELRQYYRQEIKSKNSNPESKGANLGLIEMARRASGKLEYSFVPYEDGSAFFTLNVMV